jgi:hypothetical protein
MWTSRGRSALHSPFLLALALAVGCATGQSAVQAARDNDEETEELEPLTPEEIFAAGGNAGDIFQGKDRRVAKTSISTAPVETFASIVALRQSLQSDEAMRALNPPISSDPSSDRIDLEQRNVTVTAFIYAIKKEADRDFHVILGDAQCQAPSCFMNAEVSGLPKSTQHPDRPALKAVRTSFVGHFNSEPGTSKVKTFSEPLPVTVTGSLFFDVHHSAGEVGPACCRPDTVWEIHPLTDVTFQ